MNAIWKERRLRIAALGLAGIWICQQAAQALEVSAADVRRDATVVAVEQVLPCVVNIATKSIRPVRSIFDQYFPQIPRPQLFGEYYSLGSGVVIDEAGYLLTNDHVVRQASEIAVKFSTGADVYTATVIASDPRRDIALLKINAPAGEKFHAIKLAREDDLLLGETVLALGNPVGLGGSVTRGILSSKTRSVPKENVPLDIPNWLQTDAPINHGNSGGPLVNLRGELIGINVAVLSEVQGEPVQGIGFAIPIRVVEEALADILPTEFVKSFWFGARVKVGSYPLVITSVQPDSPAGRAGLHTGDAVLQVNGKVPKTFIDFGELLATNAAAEIAMTVRRGADLNEVKLRLVPVEKVFNADMIRKKLGLTLEARTLQFSGRAFKAFMVADVEAGGPASAARLQDGMFVTAIDGQSPEDVTTLAKNLFSKSKGDHVQLDVLTIQRQGDFGISMREWIAELSLR